MVECTVKLPDILHEKACEVSRINSIPLDEYIAASLAQNLYNIIPDPYLEERANRATGKGLSFALSQVPGIEPEEFDRL